MPTSWRPLSGTLSTKAPGSMPKTDGYAMNSQRPVKPFQTCAKQSITCVKIYPDLSWRSEVPKSQINVFQRLAVGFQILAKYNSRIMPRSSEADIAVVIGTQKQKISVKPADLVVLLENGFRVDCHEVLHFRLPEMDKDPDASLTMAEALKRAQQRLDEQDLTVFSLRKEAEDLAEELVKTKQKLRNKNAEVQRLTAQLDVGQAAA